jgi:hypothetical protein
VEPTSGSRFIKLRALYDFIDIKTDHNSDIGSFEVTLAALKDGLPHEVPVLNLNVLSEHRKLHESACHSVTATVDPFADWRGDGNGLFTQVTKTWIYDQ